MPAVKSNENSALSEYEEPTLMDVLKAVQQCHVSLGALTGQVQGQRGLYSSPTRRTESKLAHKCIGGTCE